LRFRRASELDLGWQSSAVIWHQRLNWLMSAITVILPTTTRRLPACVASHSHCASQSVYMYIGNPWGWLLAVSASSNSWCRGRRSLHSARSNRLLVPSVRLSTVCGRAFPVAGPSVWNDLPDTVTSAPTLSTFRQRLKTYLFSLSFPDIILDW